MCLYLLQGDYYSTPWLADIKTLGTGMYSMV